MTEDKIRELSLFSIKARKNILSSIHSAKSGHPGGSLSAIDYLTYLYNVEMNVNPENPMDENRDRFVLSKGHIAPALYAVLAQKGFFQEDSLLTLRAIGSFLQGHPNMDMTPGVDLSTGSLGQGVSGAVGMAMASKYMKMDINIYSLLGDGEIAEGQVWEAAAYASHYKLDNLCLAIDVNRLQIDGFTKDVMNMEPINEKFKAFGFNVIKINGHDFNDLEKGFNFFHKNKDTGKPSMILLDTIKGKGVSYMENNANWHGKAPNEEQYKEAIKELEEIEKMIMEVS